MVLISPKFQFLGRNSGRSDEGDVQYVYADVDVSIPRSEFWSFGRVWFFVVMHGLRRFNSSVGILVVRTAGTFAEAAEVLEVSIPRSEFWSFGRKSSHQG